MVFSLSIQIEDEDGFLWWLTTIYGPARNNNKQLFQDELSNLENICSPSWLLAGDFNIIRWKNKTNAKQLDKNNMDLFNDFIQRNQLVDYPLSNNKFTWSNLRLTPTYSRLDRFLFTRSWEHHCNQHFSRSLVRMVSDQFSIVLETT